MKSMMTPDKRNQTFTVAARFSPDDGDKRERARDMLRFVHFWTMATDRLRRIENESLRERHKVLREREREVRKLLRLRPKVDRIVQDCFEDKITAREAAKEFRRLVPDRTLALKLYGIYKPMATVTSQEAAQAEKNLRWKEAKLKRDEAKWNITRRLIRARGSVHRALGLLDAEAKRGNEQALKWLVESAIEAAGLVFGAESVLVEPTKSLARVEACWPVLIPASDGWEETVRQRVNRLELGRMIPMLTRLRKPRGDESSLPARQWARAAVTAIDETRVRVLMMREIFRGFGSPDDLWEWCKSLAGRYPFVRDGCLTFSISRTYRLTRFRCGRR
jgi:hypothetical protein